jgi:hypothetical protein
MRRGLALLAAATLVTLAAPVRAEETQEWAARHVLIGWKGAMRSTADRSKEEAKALAQKVLAELAAPGADFAAVSTTYSDDKVSAAQGGFLGFFGRGVMDERFQRAVEALQPGELSGVVESAFGYHVIQRLSSEEALAIVQRTRAAIVIAFFPWKGLPRSTATRAKELAADDATKAMEAVRAGTAMSALPAVLDAQPAAPGFQTQVISRGAIRPEFKMLEEAGFETPAGYAVIQRVAYFRHHVQHLVVLYKGSAAPDPTITRTKEEARARAEEALKKYEADPAAWKSIVGQYSDEPEAGFREGDLGIAEPGKFVPAFDVGIAALKPGEHTKVFETPFGFHVARRPD